MLGSSNFRKFEFEIFDFYIYFNIKLVKLRKEIQFLFCALSVTDIIKNSSWHNIIDHTLKIGFIITLTNYPLYSLKFDERLLFHFCDNDS